MYKTSININYEIKSQVFNHSKSNRYKMKLYELLEEVEMSLRHVHNQLGCGLKVFVYKEYLKHVLSMKRIEVKTDVLFDIMLDDYTLKDAIKSDLVIGDEIVVMFVRDTEITIGHHQMFKSLLRFSAYQYGFLLNFNSYNISNGIERYKMKKNNFVISSSSLKWIEL